VIFLPAAADTGVTQERIGWPSRCTVQAPHRATPQPNLVPVRPIDVAQHPQQGHVVGSQIQANYMDAIPGFRRTHVTAILINVAQLVAIVWTLVSLSR
jgi:hypothetical protein